MMAYSSLVQKTSDYHNIDIKTYQTGYQFDNGASKQQRSRNAWQDIAWNTFFLTFPMFLLTCVLFALVFTYRVPPTDVPFEQLRGSDSSSILSSDAYFVDLSSTFLIFIASWMSSLAPMLAGFAIALAAYPVAGRFYNDTIQSNGENLLTPFQLQLTLRLVAGSTWSTLWNVLLYRLSWGKRARRQGTALTSLLRFTYIVVFLG